MGTFTNLRQTATIEEYHTQFAALSNRNSRLTEEFRISTFISGLRGDLRIKVTLFEPTTLLAIFGLAKLLEEEILQGVRG